MPAPCRNLFVKIEIAEVRRPASIDGYRREASGFIVATLVRLDPKRLFRVLSRGADTRVRYALASAGRPNDNTPRNSPRPTTMIPPTLIRLPPPHGRARSTRLATATQFPIPRNPTSRPIQVTGGQAEDVHTDHLCTARQLTRDDHAFIRTTVTQSFLKSPAL